MQVMAARERAESVYTHIPLLFILLRTLLHRAKRNLFLFKRFRTLCPKTPGGVRSTNQPLARRPLSESVVCRIHYLSRRRASDVLLESAVHTAKLFSGHG